MSTDPLNAVFVGADVDGRRADPGGTDVAEVVPETAGRHRRADSADLAFDESPVPARPVLSDHAESGEI